MPSRERVAPVDAIREAARAYAEATSQRHAAREIGLSPTGFRAFLSGGDPHPRTLHKLTAWYVRHEREQGGEPNSEAVQAALWLLVAALPPDERAAAVQRLSEVRSSLLNNSRHRS